MNRAWKRRRYPIVDRSHQYRFLALILIYNSLIVLFLAISLFVPEILRLDDETLSLEVRAIAADNILTLHSRVWPAVIALICFIGMHSFRSFHRFIGPLFRFRQAFAQIRSGDLSFRLKLRKNDYLHNEENSFNQMLESLADKMRGTRAAYAETLNSLNDLEKTGIEAAATRALHQHLDTLREGIDYFRTEPQVQGPQSQATSERAVAQTVSDQD